MHHPFRMRTRTPCALALLALLAVAVGGTGCADHAPESTEVGSAEQAILSEEIRWTELANVSVCGPSTCLPGDVTGPVLKKTGTQATEDAGAISTQSLTGDGSLRTKVGQLGGTTTNPTADPKYERWIGFTKASNRVFGNGIEYAFRLNERTAEVREGGSLRASTPMTYDDTLKIEVLAGRVRYFKNSTLLYTSTVSTSGLPLRVSASFKTPYGILNDIALTRDIACAPPSAPISNLGVTNLSTNPKISWTTPVDCDSEVHYADNPGFTNPGQPVYNALREKNHAITLPAGLTAGRTYYFRVYSKDAKGNTIQSADKSFTKQSDDPLAPEHLPPFTTTRQNSNIWTTGALAKVKPTALPGAEYKVDISASRNEFESFQIHTRGYSSTPLQLNVVVGATLVNKANPQAPIYIDNSNVRISREEYVYVEPASAANGWVSKASDANGDTGEIPDGLTPSYDVYTNKERKAFPVSIANGVTRSAWIDVYVPQGTPSGYYMGSVLVKNGTTLLQEIPIRLKVWDFELPSTASLRSYFRTREDAICAFAYGGDCAKYPGVQGAADPWREGYRQMADTMKRFLLDHRISGVHMPNTYGWSDFDSANAPYLNGTAATRLPGAKLTSAAALGWSSAQIADWVNHFQAHTNQNERWSDRLFFYYCDEPSDVPEYGGTAFMSGGKCRWLVARNDARALKAASADARPLLTTSIALARANGSDPNYSLNLLDNVDYLAPVLDHMWPRGGALQRYDYVNWLKLPNKHLWWYQSCDQHENCGNNPANKGTTASTWPSYMIDAAPMRNRIFQWMAWLYKIEGELYYDTTNCWFGACGGNQGTPLQHQYNSGGQGDGTLIYPGLSDPQVQGSKPGPMSSIRLELIRDGMEDFEYLTASDNAEALSTANSIITNAYTFTKVPAALLAAREKLGTHLHKKRHPQ